MKKRNIFLIVFGLLFLFGFSRNADALVLRGQAHNADVGWGPHVAVSGSSPRIEIGSYGKRLEAFALSVDYVPIRYRSHIQNIGWEGAPERSNGIVSGTVGQALRIEAVRIRAENGGKYGFKYRVHFLGGTWSSYSYSAQLAGTVGQGRAIDVIEVQIYRK